MSKLMLKGSMYGIKNIKSYHNPNILYSIVDKNKCQINDLKIKYNKDKNNFYISHSYDGIDSNMNKVYYGRWRNFDFNFEPGKTYLKLKTNTFEIQLKNVEWEDFDTGKTKIKNVKIKIFLSCQGFTKLTNFFNKYK